jgi:GNAT superfamily N-acetyltransferase
MIDELIIEQLSKRHDRLAFDCEREVLNNFLKNFARQNDEKGLGRTYVLALPNEPKIYGYYTISSGSVEFDFLSEEQKRKLPRFPVPVSHIGRLAVDKTAKGNRLGELLLMDGFKKTLNAAKEIGIYAVEVKALDNEAKSFYLKYGFTELLDDPLHLYLSIKTIRKLGL